MLQHYLRAIKLFYELLHINNGRAVWDYRAITQEQFTDLFTKYDAQEFQDTPHPYRRSLAPLQAYMVTLQSPKLSIQRQAPHTCAYMGGR